MANEPNDSYGNNDQRRSTDLPWAQVVKGAADSEPSITHPDEINDSANANVANSNANVKVTLSVDEGSSSSGGAAAAAAAAVTGKKAAWSKPSNGVVIGSGSGSGSVMGAESWPALSASTRVSPRVSGSANNANAGSSISRGFAANGSASNFQKHADVNAGSSSHMAPGPSSSRPRPKRGGGSGNPSGPGGVPSGFAYSHGPPPPPPLPPFPIYPVNGYALMAPPPAPPLPSLSPDTSPRDLQFRASIRGPRPGGGFPSQGGNDHRKGRRGHFVPHPRGEGSSHNNHGGRHDQDWNNGSSQNIPVMNPRGHPRGYIRHPLPNPLPFMGMPPPVRSPYVNPMGYPEFPYLPPQHIDPYTGVPLGPTPPGMIMPGPEPVSGMLVRQIEYYFSDENLVKDNYLKSNMDDHGWVPVSLIAGFPRVKKLMEDINQNNNSVDNIQFILDSLRPSLTVEVQDGKLRRRNEWVKWVDTSSGPPSDSGSKSTDESNYSMLESSFNKMSVGECSASQDSMTANSDTSSGALAEGFMPEASGQSSLPNGEHSTKDDVPSMD